MRFVKIVLLLAMIFLLQGQASHVLAEEKEDYRFCVGLLWCTETKEGSVKTVGFLYLYSSEQMGTFSRFSIRPFYAKEVDPERDYVRKSFLWPLGDYVQAKDSHSLKIIPFYWHWDRPDRQVTIIAPLYWHWNWNRNRLDKELTIIAPLYFNYARGVSSYTYVLPLYGQSESPGHRMQFLFPFYGSTTDKPEKMHRWSMIGLPPIPRLLSIPTLALYEHMSGPGMVADRFFPLYRYAHFADKDRTELDALLLYQHRSTPQITADRLIPLYTYQSDREKEEHEFSLLGYRMWSLGYWLSTPTLIRNHFFPLYSFEGDAERQVRKFGFVGFGKASLYFHQDGPESVSDRLFPLYFYDRPHADEVHVSVLGLAPVALYQHHAKADGERDRLFPLYDYARKGEDRNLSLLGVSQVALYRHEISPAWFRHRLFPLYRYSHDYVKNETDFNALFIYRHVARQGRVVDQLLPIWDYTSDRDRAWDLGLVGIAPLTLYRYQTNAWSSEGHFFPLYGYRISESEGHKVSLVGFPPSRHRLTWAFYEHVSRASLTSDRFFPLYTYSHNKAVGEYEWNVLWLYYHKGWDTGAKDMLLPLHQFAYDLEKNTWQLSLLGVSPFTLYSHWTSPNKTTAHFFPLYGYRRMNDTRRWSLIGLPPIGTWPAFSLYEHAVRGSQTTDRFFPLYYYAHDDVREEITLSALFVYWHKSSPTMAQNSLFPLLSVSSDEVEKEWKVSAIGLDPFVPVSLFHQAGGEDVMSGRLFPLYDYRRDGAKVGVSLVGVNKFALYRHEKDAAKTRDWLFPLWEYQHDASSETTRLGLLGYPPVSVYLHNQSPEKTSDWLFPLWRYQYDASSETTRLGLLGYPPVSLYLHDQSPEKTSDRLFPFYAYAANHKTGMAEFSVLWPFFNYKSQDGQITEASLLWWLFRYTSPSSESREVSILGIPPAAVILSSVTPQRTLFEFNPILPLYHYESEKDKGVSWTILGGLLGSEVTDKKERKLRLFWMLW